MSDEGYNQYIEALLNAQFEAAELLKHELTKGQVRERFIRQQINEQFGLVLCVSGVLSLPQKGTYKQCDLAILDRETRRRVLGDEYLLRPEDTRLLADIKSTLNKRDVAEWDSIALKLQRKYRDKTPQIGLIAYRWDSSLTALLRNFGFKFDSTIQAYIPNHRQILNFNNLDFVFVLDNSIDDKRILLRRNPRPRGRAARNFHPFVLFREDDASRQFWEMLQSLSRATAEAL